MVKPANRVNPRENRDTIENRRGLKLFYQYPQKDPRQHYTYKITAAIKKREKTKNKVFFGIKACGYRNKHFDKYPGRQH